jgi:hypothetical protein
LNSSAVIPDARNARDRESRAKPTFLDRRWILGQAFGLPGMTSSKRRDHPVSVRDKASLRRGGHSLRKIQIR